MVKKFYLFFIVSSFTFATSFATDFQISLNFRLYGGYSSLNSGDIRKDIQSLDQYYKDWATYYQSRGYSAEVMGGHKPIQNGLGGGGEILLGFSMGDLNLGVGLGLEYFTKTKESSQDLNLRWDQGNSFHNRTRDMEENIGVTGILFKGNFSYNIIPQIAFFADLGIGVYMAKINYDLGWNGKYEYWDYDWYVDSYGYWRYGWHKYMYGNWNLSDKFEISKNKIGFTGGLGIEVSLIKNLSFFVEAKGRYLNLAEVKARETLDYYDSWKVSGRYYSYDDLRYWYSDYDQENWSSEDTLYLYNYYSKARNKTYTFVTANKAEYAKYTNYSDFRPAKIDLSGFNILFGIRIKLF
ncbi:MAG: hypothetical protein AB1410_03645 [Acidobacteriota bacterium]